jgi:hypothetical protein
LKLQRQNSSDAVIYIKITGELGSPRCQFLS